MVCRTGHERACADMAAWKAGRIRGRRDLSSGTLRRNLARAFHAGASTSSFPYRFGRQHATVSGCHSGGRSRRMTLALRFVPVRASVRGFSRRSRASRCAHAWLPAWAGAIAAPRVAGSLWSALSWPRTKRNLVRSPTGLAGSRDHRAASFGIGASRWGMDCGCVSSADRKALPYLRKKPIQRRAW